MIQVRLTPGLPGRPFALLRDLRGTDEVAIDGTSSSAATALLDRLLIEAPSIASVVPGDAADLALADRDRLLATLYSECFGDRIEGSVQCPECGELRDIDFSLEALQRSLEPENPRADGPNAEGVYTLGDGRQFRLPTSRDLDAVAALSSDKARVALLERCLVSGDPAIDPETVEAAMEEVGPVLNLDLPRTCPECQAPQSVHFSIESYLMHALAHERQWLIREVHYLATAYGWSLKEILGLLRRDRRAFVSVIDADLGIRGREDLV